MKRLVIFDGNSIINRAFYAIRLLSNKKGVYTNAVYGFFNIFFKYLGEDAPDYICVAFDLKAPTFRHIEYEGYKAQRKPMPGELAEQMPITKDILRAMNVAILEKEGYEADDIIGTVSKMCENEGIRCEIITGDKDDLQLASEKTNVYLVTTRMGNSETVIYDHQKVFEKYGVTPAEFIDVKAIMGDPSDNIPGVSGIGEKGALALISKYKSIENIYENIEALEVTQSVKEKLINGRDMAFKSKFLATIMREVPLDGEIAGYAVKEYDVKRLKEILTELELFQLMKRLDVNGTAPEETKVSYKVEVCKTEAAEAVKTIKGEMCYYIEQNNGDITAFGVYGGKDKVWLWNDGAKAAVLEFKSVFEDEEIKKITHNIKEDIVFLHSLGIEYAGVGFDTVLAAYLIDPARSGYKVFELSDLYLNWSIYPKDRKVTAGGQMMFLGGDEENETADESVAYATYAILKLKEIFSEKLEELGQTELYNKIELPLAPVLAKMQIEGFKVDREMLAEFSVKLNERIKELTKDIYETAGEEFNINSTKQLGVILFEKLELKAGKKTKTGYSTDAATLEKLKGTHPIIESLLEYRQLAKLKSTYADGLIAVIDRVTGKIHSSFNQTVTVTGRLSSTEPNLQNIPVRLELGREIRKMFIASDDNHILIGGDYSQIELRVLAHMADDPVMIEAFKKGEDIHTITASQVFGVDLEKVTSRMRSNAKAVNFGILYGMGDFSLAQDLGITRREAREYIDNYLARYSKIHEYMKNVVKEARDKGYAETIFGRRRYIPELAMSNKVTQAFGERVALNMPVQGTAADIMKLAMINIDRALKNNKFNAKVILQVHDELILDTPKSEAEEVKAMVKEHMENVVQLKVPLVVEMKEGHSWYETK